MSYLDRDWYKEAVKEQPLKRERPMKKILLAFLLGLIIGAAQDYMYVVWHRRVVTDEADLYQNCIMTKQGIDSSKSLICTKPK